MLPTIYTRAPAENSSVYFESFAMKLFLTLTCLSLAVLSSMAMKDEKHIEMLKGILAECQKTEGGSAGDFDTLMLGKFPETHEGSCMISCINEKIGIVRICDFCLHMQSSVYPL